MCGSLVGDRRHILRKSKFFVRRFQCSIFISMISKHRWAHRGASGRPSFNWTLSRNSSAPTTFALGPTSTTLSHPWENRRSRIHLHPCGDQRTSERAQETVGSRSLHQELLCSTWQHKQTKLKGRCPTALGTILTVWARTCFYQAVIYHMELMVIIPLLIFKFRLYLIYKLILHSPVKLNKTLNKILKEKELKSTWISMGLIFL